MKRDDREPMVTSINQAVSMQIRSRAVLHARSISCGTKARLCVRNNPDPRTHNTHNRGRHDASFVKRLTNRERRAVYFYFCLASAKWKWVEASVLICAPSFLLLLFQSAAVLLPLQKTRHFSRLRDYAYVIACSFLSFPKNCWLLGSITEF